MTAIRVTQKAVSAEALGLSLVEQADLKCAGTTGCLVEIHSAGVNPSDVKAILGLMPHAVWPRTPGRDFAGIVIEGPSALVGKSVWGSGGELGIRRDGSHARHLAVDAASLRAKPEAVSMVEAGAVGVPFVTAYDGLRRAGMPKPGQVVAVMGANGKVGQATVQLATRAGARVIAIQRGATYQGHANGPIDLIDAGAGDVAQAIRDLTSGHGADLVYNTVGSPYFEAANRAMAIGATQILISTLERPVPFDILQFYRGRHCFVGVDTLALDSSEGAAILELLTPGFEDGTLKPFPVASQSIYPLTAAADAYRAVLGGARERIVLKP